MFPVVEQRRASPKVVPFKSCWDVFKPLPIWYFSWKQGQEGFPASLAFYDGPFSAQEVDKFARWKLKLDKENQFGVRKFGFGFTIFKCIYLGTVRARVAKQKDISSQTFFYFETCRNKPY